MQQFEYTSVDRRKLLDQTVIAGNFSEPVQVFKGGETIETTIGELLYNLITQDPVPELREESLWFRAIDGVQTVSDHYTNLQVAGGSAGVSSEAIAKMNARLMYLANIRNIRVGSQLHLYEIYRLRKEIPEIAELMDEPFQDYLFPQAFQKELTRRSKRFLELISAVPESTWGDFFRAGILQVHQVAQMFLAIGCRPNNQAHIPAPIYESYFRGFSDMRACLLLALANRQVESITHRSIRDSGKLESLLYGICNDLQIDYQMEDCGVGPDNLVRVNLSTRTMLKNSIGLEYYHEASGTFKTIKISNRCGEYLLRSPVSCRHPSVDRFCIRCCGKALARRHLMQGMKFGPAVAIVIGNRIYQLRLSVKHSYDEMAVEASITDPGGLFYKIFTVEHGFLFPTKFAKKLTLVIREDVWDEELVNARKGISPEVSVSIIEVWKDRKFLNEITFNNSIIVTDWDDIGQFQEEMSPEYHIPVTDFVSGNTGPLFELRGVTVGLETRLLIIRNVVRFSKAEDKCSLETPEEWLAATLIAAEQAGLTNVPTAYWSGYLRLLWKDAEDNTRKAPDVHNGQLLALSPAIAAHSPETALGVIRKPPLNSHLLFSKSVRGGRSTGYFRRLFYGAVRNSAEK